VHVALRLRKQIVSLAAVGIAGWLLAFAVHFHFAGQHEDASPTQTQHPCLLCAAFQPGAGPVAALNAAVPQKSFCVDSFVSKPALIEQPCASYRSRAPPLG
jgi:hypothetical protein